MILIQKREISYLFVAFFGIVVNCIFRNIFLSMVTSIALLITSLIGIKKYTSSIKNNNITSEKSLIIISSITLVLSLMWIILNIFTFFIILSVY